MWDYIKLVVLGLIAVSAAIAANYARDLAYLVNAIEVMLAAAIVFVVVLRGLNRIDQIGQVTGVIGLSGQCD